jgi:hypothetical protein
MSLANRIKQRISGLNFFQIYFKNKIGNSYDHFLSTEELKQVDMDKIIRDRNNDSFLTPDNWSNHKKTFFNQRMESYKSSFTIDEKINLELENIDLITIDNTDHKILKDRYKAFLLNRLEQAKAVNNSTDNEVPKIIDQYKSCSNVSFDSVFMKVQNDDGTQNQRHYIKLSKQYYDSLKIEEQQKNTRIKEYKLDGMSFFLFRIFRQLFQNIQSAQIGHNNKCKNGHTKLVQSVLGMKIFANGIRMIGESKPFDMIETSVYYLGVLSTFDLKMQELGVNIKTSPLNGLFQDVINDLKELSSYKRINKEVALKELRKDQPQQKKTDKPIKTLNDYFINIDEDNKEDFYKELKVLFPTEKGKSIKVIIDELKVQNMLVIGAREFKAFHAELGKTFNRDIGTYQSIQNVKSIDKVSSEPIKIKLNSLIIKYKSN